MTDRVLMRKLSGKILEEGKDLLEQGQKFQTDVRESYMTASIVLTHLARAIIKTEEEL